MARKKHSTSFSFGYLVFFGACGLLAVFPWIFKILTSPLPVDFQQTGTALAATRTARLVTPLSVATTNREPTLPPPTRTPAPTATDTPTITPSVTNSPTPTKVLTPTPVVMGINSEAVRTYSCPGDENRVGTLESNISFAVLGWDETLINNKLTTWILIEDEINQPQVWIKDSEYLVLTNPDYQEIIQRVACRVP